VSRTPRTEPSSLVHRFQLQAFEAPGYGNLWAASVASNVGRWMEQIAVGWIAFELTHSPFLVALIGFYRSLPLFLLGMFGGVLGDRYDRRRLVAILQFLNAVAMVAVAILVLRGELAFWQLVVAELVMGVSQAFEWPSRRALIVDVAGRAHLANAVALDATASNLSRAVGPLLAGALIQVFNPGSTVAFLAGIYLVNGLLVLRVPQRSDAPVLVKNQGVLQSLAAGFGHVLQDEAIVGVLVVTVWMNLLFFPYQQLLPVVAVDVLHSDSLGLGILGAADGVGSLIGTVLLTMYVGSKRNGFYFWTGSLLGSAALLGFGFSRSLVLAAGLLLLGGLIRSGFSAYQSTILLRNSSDEMRGRTMGVLTLAIGVGPFGSLEIGALAQAFGAPGAILLNAGLCTVLVGAAIARYRGMRMA
jgi:predicted MFS family arabinose efflux permease